MKIDQVEVNGRYRAKVSGVLTIVRVIAIRDVPPAWHGSNQGRWQKRIDVINERTGRKISLASAQRLRSRVDAPEPKGGDHGHAA